MKKRELQIRLEESLADIDRSIGYLQAQLGPGWQLHKMTTGQMVGIDLISARAHTLFALTVLTAYPDAGNAGVPQLEE
jgi:hypothetical protein